MSCVQVFVAVVTLYCISPMLKKSRVEIKDRLKYYKVSEINFKFNLPAGVPMIQPFVDNTIS